MGKILKCARGELHVPGAQADGIEPDLVAQERPQLLNVQVGDAIGDEQNFALQQRWGLPNLFGSYADGVLQRRPLSNSLEAQHMLQEPFKRGHIVRMPALAQLQVEGAEEDLAQLCLVAAQEDVDDRFRQVDAMVALHRSGGVEEHVELLLADIGGVLVGLALVPVDLRRTRRGHPQRALCQPVVEHLVGQQELVRVDVHDIAQVADKLGVVLFGNEVALDGGGRWRGVRRLLLPDAPMQQRCQALREGMVWVLQDTGNLVDERELCRKVALQRFM